MRNRVKIVWILPDDRREYVTAPLGVAFDVARAIARRENQQVFLYGKYGNADVRADGTGSYSFYDEKTPLDGLPIYHGMDAHCYPCI